MKKFLLTICWVIFTINVTLGAFYHPNPGLEEKLEKIQQYFVQLKSDAKSNTQPSKQIFLELKNLMWDIQDYIKNINHKIVIQTCEKLSQKLYEDFSWNKLLDYESKCIQAFQDMLYELKKQYTVKAKINAIPKSWPAPLSVTFDAKWSKDPSWETISKNNIFWYYIDVNWKEIFMGKGYSINHTFEEPWEYVVHVTIRSINKNTKGILDGHASTVISVGEKIGNIVIFANWKKLNKNVSVKFWTQEASNGIVFDASATKPNGARKIVEYTFEIVWVNNKFQYKYSWKGSPKIFNVPLKKEWIYNVKLTIKDNTNKTLTEEFEIIVSDPIAYITILPENWNTSTVFNFDARWSYSIKSKIISYKWTIYSPNGKILTKKEAKNFKQKFKIPGIYTIKLTVVTENWQKNDDFRRLNVESTPPIADFSITPIRKWEKPSQFVLDGSISYDPDVSIWVDQLTYTWNVSDQNNIKITKISKNNEKVLLTINKPWNYKITLEVQDKYWKLNTITKEINVESTLRPKITVQPQVWVVNSSFVIKVTEENNKPIVFYEYDFGDWTITKTNKSQVSHIYKQAGVYTLIVRVSSPSWETNTISSQVFVWEKDRPIPVYKVEKGDTILQPNWYCKWKKAYIVYRYDRIKIDASESLNSKWIKGQDLNIYFKLPDWKTKYSKIIEYIPDELWCFPIKLYVQQKDTTKIASTTIWLKVENAPPTLKNLILSFPQYWNQQLISANLNNPTTKDIFTEQFDPIIIKVQANGAIDPDWPGWLISYFIWYYYEWDDKENIKEIKVTPWNIPYINFAVPRVAWKYKFGVKLVDVDWKISDAEDILKWLPTIVIPRDSWNPEIPLIESFEIFPTIAEIDSEKWAKVTFRVKAKVFTNQQLFEKNKVIKLDADGDWLYDITTKNDTIVYYYKKPGIYRPKVKVMYKTYSSTKYGKQIEIKQWLKANFLENHFDKYIIVKDLSIWNITKREFCFDIKKCKKNKKYISSKVYDKFKYDSYWKKVLKLSVWDEDNGLTDSRLKPIDISEKKIEDVAILTIPSIKANTIKVWKNLNNEILFYIISNKEKKIWCYLDPDISQDEDWDGNPIGDKIIYCNQLINYKYNPILPNVTARLYIISWDQTIEKDINIQFLDIQLNLPEELIWVYNELNSIIQQLDSNNSVEKYLKDLLIQLINTLDDPVERDWIIVQIKQYIEEDATQLLADKEELIKKIELIIKKLAGNQINNIIYWWDEYTRLKDEIILTFPIDYQEKIQQIFNQIEVRNIPLKQGLIQILEIAKSLVEQRVLEKTEFDIIKADACDILNIYDIPSEACGTQQQLQTQEIIEAGNEENQSSLIISIFKWIVIVLIIWIVIFLSIIVFFAIKAKMQMKESEEDEEKEG